MSTESPFEDEDTTQPTSPAGRLGAWARDKRDTVSDRFEGTGGELASYVTGHWTQESVFGTFKSEEEPTGAKRHFVYSGEPEKGGDEPVADTSITRRGVLQGVGAALTAGTAGGAAAQRLDDGSGSQPTPTPGNNTGTPEATPEATPTDTTGETPSTGISNSQNYAFENESELRGLSREGEGDLAIGYAQINEETGENYLGAVNGETVDQLLEETDYMGIDSENALTDAEVETTLDDVAYGAGNNYALDVDLRTGEDGDSDFYVELVGSPDGERDGVYLTRSGAEKVVQEVGGYEEIWEADQFM